MRLPTPRVSRTLLPALVLSSLAALLAAPLMSNRRGAPETPAVDASKQARLERAGETYGRVPLSFEANRGQTDASVNFLARGAGYALFLKPAEAVLVLRDADSGLRVDEGRPVSDPSSNPQSRVLRMKVVGADASAAAEGVEELAGKANYLVGRDPSQWRADVPTYARVRYAEVYRGVDLVYYGNQRQLEYDFHVAPGADARAVSLEFEGADEVEVDAGGDLLLRLGESVVRQQKPFVYQEVAGARREVEAGYELGADGRVRFAVGEYDPAHTLVIDPVIVYSTYLGGVGTDDGIDIKVDSAGNAYVCGQTNSTDFPTANAIQATFGGATFEGGRDGFVTKLNAAGTAFVYSTYLGGSGDDRCNKIAVDSAGNAYLAGETTSSNFPTANALQATFGGGLSDAFVTKLNATGSAFVYSTYLGGSVFDSGNGIALDSSNNVYVTGRTTSSNFPTLNPIQAAYSGGPFADAYVTKIRADGSALVYSTYLGGGTGFEVGFSIAVDSTNSAYVTGQTSSTNFPTANAIQATFGGGSPDGDAFVTKINAAGDALSYSTYLGGSDNDIGFEIAVDSAGSAYVAGVARSPNFPVANAIQSARKGASDAFVAKLSAAGTALAYSTYFGGSGDDSGNGIAVDSSGNAYLAGGTDSNDVPTANPTQAASGGGVEGFVTQFDAAGTALLFSTYLGGTGGDAALGIALDSANAMYVVGRTNSITFPTVGPAQGSIGGGQDAFVTKIAPGAAATSTFRFSQVAYAADEAVSDLQITVQRTGDTSGAATVDYATVDGTASERSDYTTALGTLRFAAGQGEATVTLLVNEDSFTEGNETFTIALLNPTGGPTLSPTAAAATVQINDDATEPTANVIDDPVIFVGQHYHDFLNRQADPAGLNFWAGQITACGSDAGCIDRRRTAVSSAFFLSIEFQQTGFLVHRFYKASFADSAARPRGLARYREFLRDTQEIGRGVVVGQAGWEQVLETNKREFTLRWVQRPDFLAEFPTSMSFDDYVAKLAANSGATLTPDEINLAFESYSNTPQGRANALRAVLDSRSVYNAQFNTGFVLSQYIGYLRRNPNDPPDANYAGFDFWLAKLNSFSQPGEDMRNEQTALERVKRAEMVRAFILSLEYRGRFGQP